MKNKSIGIAIFLLSILVICSSSFAQKKHGSLTIEWDPNTESDLAGYRVYYGEQSRAYSHQIDVGNVTRFKIANLEEGKVYYIAVTAYDYWNNESKFSNEVSAAAKSNSDQTNIPDVLILFQNYPNPFNPETLLQFNVPSEMDVSLSIWNTRGQLMKILVHQKESPGLHHVIWNGKDSFGRNVPSGTYFVRLKSDRYILSQKMLLIR